MSKYTTELRFICETLCRQNKSKGYDNTSTIINTSAPLLFNFDFPIFDENYRLPLEVKIIRHFYTREISEETVGLWKLRLEDRLNVIMPYYNELYRSALLTFNPFYDVDVTRTHEGSNVGEQNRKQESHSSVTGEKEVEAKTNGSSVGNMKDTTNETNLNWDLYSDTPQGGINGITADSDSVANNTYLTNARKTTGDRGVTSNADSSNISQQESKSKDTDSSVATATADDKTSITNLEQYGEKVIGKQGSASYSEMLIQFRKTFINIDKMVLDELETLFFGLW